MSLLQSFLSLEGHPFPGMEHQQGGTKLTALTVMTGSLVWGFSRLAPGSGALECVWPYADEGFFLLLVLSPGGKQVSAVRPDRGRAGNLGEPRNCNVRELFHTLSEGTDIGQLPKGAGECCKQHTLTNINIYTLSYQLYP